MTNTRTPVAVVAVVFLLASVIPHSAFAEEISDVDPVVTGPLDPVPVGASIGFSGSEPGIWSWGDGTSTSSSVLSVSHVYDSTGVYPVTLTGGDDATRVSAVLDVVVYDPTAGFVTGGGWIESPAGSYAPEPEVAGTANFGFVSKYRKGKVTPDGSTTFVLRDTSFRFRSSNFEWMVISGYRAQFKGTGTIGDQDGYGFLLTAIDGNLQNPDDDDRFRIKIWEIVSETVVYDNERGSSDSDDPATALSGGSIVIHDDKDKKGDPVNQVPMADAGPDRSTTVGDAVLLDGSASSDPEGQPLTYQWNVETVPEGGTAALTTPTEETTLFTADTPGDYVVSLVVSDGDLTSAPDSVGVTVLAVNAAPVAADDTASTDEDAPITIEVLANDTDVDGDPLSVAVSQDPTFGTAGVTADNSILYTPNPDFHGEDQFQYTISDGALTDTATVVVTVIPVNDPPVANAGDDQTVAFGTGPVLFDGGGSVDPDGDELTFAWVILTSPPGSVAELTDAHTATPGLVPDVVGTFELQLTVGDGTLTDTDTVLLHVEGSPLTVSVRDPLIGVQRSTPGDVVLSVPAPSGGVTVTLSLSDGTVGSLSETEMFLPEGATTATFDVTGEQPGLTTVSADAPGYIPDSVDVEVTDYALNIGETLVVGPGESTSLPLSVSQTDPSDLEVSLSVVDPDIASVPDSAIIPAGRLTPDENPQVTGLSLGITEIVVSAPGVAPDRRTVEVALTGAISPTSVTQPVGWDTIMTVSISAPAPTGGMELALTMDDPIAEVPSGVVIPAGQLSATFLLVGTAEGISTLRIDGVGFTAVSAAVRTLETPDAQLSSPGQYRVGAGLQVARSVSLTWAPEEPTDIVVESSDPGVTLSRTPDTIGSNSIVFENVTSTRRNSFYVQGVGSSGIESVISATALRYDSTSEIAAVVDSTVGFIGSSAFVVTLQPPPALAVTPFAFTDYPQIPWSRQALLPGDVTFSVISETPEVVVPADYETSEIADPLPLSFTGGSGSSPTALMRYDGLSVGTGSLRVVQPPGFLDSERSVLSVRVDPPKVLINGGSTQTTVVGEQLQRRLTVQLNYAPPTPVDITIEVPAASGLSVAGSATTAGTATLVVPDVDSTDIIGFWVQNRGGVEPYTTFDVSASASAYEFSPDTAAVLTAQSAVVFHGDLASAARTIEATTSLHGPLGFRAVQPSGIPYTLSSGVFEPLIPGEPLDVVIENSDPTVVEVTAAGSTLSGEVGTVTFQPGQASGSLDVTGITGGTAAVTVRTPTGFVPPSESFTSIDYDRIEVSVIGQPIFSFPPEDQRVGIDLSRRLPTTDLLEVDATLTIADPAIASISGSDGVEVTSLVVPAGTRPDIWVNGLSFGSTVIEYRADGYTPFDLAVDVVPGVVYFITPNLQIDQYAEDALLRVATAINPTTGTQLEPQFVRPDASIDVAVSSANPAVATVDPGVVTLTRNGSSETFLDPVQVGLTTVSITQPAGFTSPFNGTDTIEVEVTVTGVGVFGAASAIGVDHRDEFDVRAEAAAPEDVVMTVRSSAPSVVLVSDDPAVEGAEIASDTLLAGTTTLSFSLQAVGPGSAQITIQTPGFEDQEFNVTVHPSAVRFAGATTSVPSGEEGTVRVDLVGVTPAGDTVTGDGVRPGVTVEAGLTSSDPAVVGVDPSVTFTHTTGLSRFITLTGVDAGTATVDLIQPDRVGYVAPPSNASLTVTVS